MTSQHVGRQAAARRGSGAHARVPSRALQGGHERQQRSCPSTAVRAGYDSGGRHRARARSGTAARARSRRLSLLGWTGLGRRAPGGGCPAVRAAGAPADVAARLGFRGALACVARDGQEGTRHAAQRSFLKGAAPACRLWLFVARGPGRPEGVAPVTRNAGSASVKGRGWWHSACRVPRLFAPGLRMVAR